MARHVLETINKNYSSQKRNVCLVKPAIYARVPRSYSPRSTLTITRPDPRSLTGTQTDPERSTVQLCPSRRQHLSACMQRPRGAGFCERKTSVQVCATVSFDSWTDRTPRWPVHWAPPETGRSVTEERITSCCSLATLLGPVPQEIIIVNCLWDTGSMRGKREVGGWEGGGVNVQCRLVFLVSIIQWLTQKERESGDGGRGADEKTVNGFIHPVNRTVSHQDYQTL